MLSTFSSLGTAVNDRISRDFPVEINIGRRTSYGSFVGTTERCIVAVAIVVDDPEFIEDSAV